MNVCDQQVTIKAMAASRDGLRESSVVTKTFLVKEAEQEEDEEEEMKEDEKVLYMHAISVWGGGGGSGWIGECPAL